jgi:hypothetical protein
MVVGFLHAEARCIWRMGIASSDLIRVPGSILPALFGTSIY